MANEISLTASLTFFKSTLMASGLSRALVGQAFTMHGSTFIEGSILVASGGTAVPLGQVTQPHWAFFYSNPLYNTTLTGTATTITGAANNGSGLVRITDTAHGYLTGDYVTVAGMVGATEGNGSWPITVVTANTFDLVGPVFVNAYTSGGTATLNSSIRIRNGASGADLIQLFPGEGAFVPLLAGCVPYALGNPTLQLLEYLIAAY